MAGDRHRTGHRLLVRAAEVDERVGGEIVTHAMDLLRLYLTHFPGERCTHALAVGEGPWAALGLGGAREGERVAGPLLSGVVERTLDELVLLRDAHGFVEAYAHGAQPAVRGYRFGEPAADVAARDGRAWRAWMEAHAGAPAR